MFVCKPTVSPPAGAACANESVQFKVPALLGSGLHAIDDESVCAVSRLMEAVCDTPFREAVTTAVCAFDTVPAVAVKLADALPAPTVTDAGTLSASVLLESATAVPPEAAALESVTVQVALVPEARVTGEQVSELSDPGSATVMLAVCAPPL